MPNGEYAPAVARERRITLSGTFNTRDVGGYPASGGRRVRYNRLYRSDALGNLNYEDERVLRRLGIAAVIDLRDTAEVTAAPDRLEKTDAVYHRVALFEETLFDRDLDNFPTLRDQYSIVVDEHPHQLVRAIGLLASPDGLPAIVHCTAGKDRTGLVVALALAICGVPDETILEDYGASEKILGIEFEESVRLLYDRAGLPRHILGSAPREAPPTFLAGALARIRSHHGSVAEFLEAFGFDAAAQLALRDSLTEEWAAPAG